MGSMATSCIPNSYTTSLAGTYVDIKSIVTNGYYILGGLNAIRGGTYTISVTASGSTQSLTFNVLGKNPDASAVQSYIAIYEAIAVVGDWGVQAQHRRYTCCTMNIHTSCAECMLTTRVEHELNSS